MGAQAARIVPDYEFEDQTTAAAPMAYDPRLERMVLNAMCAPSVAEDRVSATRGQLFTIIGVAVGGWAAVFGAGALFFA